MLKKIMSFFRSRKIAKEVGYCRGVSLNNLSIYHARVGATKVISIKTPPNLYLPKGTKIQLVKKSTLEPKSYAANTSEVGVASVIITFDECDVGYNSVIVQFPDGSFYNPSETILIGPRINCF